MKKITKIEYQKNNKDRVNIYLDDKFELGIDLNTMVKYSLCKNMELDEEFISEILTAKEKTKAYNYAINILTRSAKSEKELRLKMENKGYDANLIDNAMEILKKNKYIDDEAYCEMFIHDKINFSKYGKLKVKNALYNKGIDKQTIEEKLKRISDDDEKERAFEIAKKKFISLGSEQPLKKKMKLCNFLIGKGFEYETVKSVVSKLLNDDYDFE